VLGEFPSTADDTVVSIAQVEAAQARRMPVSAHSAVVGVDVARFGSDETAIATRRGSRVRVAKAYGGRDTMRTVGEVLRVARGLCEETGLPAHVVTVVVDDAGVGGGVTDRLRELDEFPVVAFNAAERAVDPESYPNRRSEQWFRFAEAVETVDLDGDEQLAADLVAPRYSIDSRGRRVVEAKAETKRRLGRSPDRADAVLLTFAPAPMGGVALVELPISGDIMEITW
jgi:hypothetical protein